MLVLHAKRHEAMKTDETKTHTHTKKNYDKRSSDVATFREDAQEFEK